MMTVRGWVILNISDLPILLLMKTIFFETTSFTARVGDFLTDDEYRQLQTEIQVKAAIEAELKKRGRK
ncbi:hypothetical protein [Pseudomonas sp. 18175]|uniref:hypothetical protein n=1 Tax=Pseudomonas sp. 18175 TaxID=3390056 RepID=UPI003D21771E